MDHPFTNRLANEASPYLRQHAHNPVDWYPWSEEAFVKARSEHKPIFLSIGYSTCHWCHVMERESFENEGVAQYLNAHYVAIKVDREERPEIDHIYMSAVQAMSGNGGWPMSVFLTPELKPFYAGTYFPAEPAYGRPSFLQLIRRIAELWTEDNAALIESSNTLTDAIRATTRPSEVIRHEDAVTDTFKYFADTFDERYGGFGGAPKFPRPSQLDFLFHYGYFRRDVKATEYGLSTLRHIAMGGIHDHVGGGFHRYSVDRYWRVSHFEKMLYDQAQLLNSFLDAWQVSQERLFADAARGIVTYVLRDLRSPEGGFFSAEDADSEGEEGKFYVWTLDEIRQAAGDDWKVFADIFDITEAGNFEHGKNVLHRSRDYAEIAKRHNSTVQAVTAIAEQHLRSLFEIRSGRVRPSLDDKVLTSWNGLMIGALARASEILEMPNAITAAIRAAEFLWNTMRVDGKLLHRWRAGDRARFHAYLEDYAFLIKGYLELYRVTFDALWLDRAITLQREQDAALWDEGDGGYFMSEATADAIFRPKTDYDGAEPAGNSITALNLISLAQLTEDSDYSVRFTELIDLFVARIGAFPYAMPELMCAAIRTEAPPRQIVFSGQLDEAVEMKQAIVKDHFLPDTEMIWAATAPGEFAKSLATESLLAYLCHGLHCELPVETAEELNALLDRSSGAV